MNKQTLIADMKKNLGSFATRKMITEYLNLADSKSVDRYLSGLPSVNQRYFIDDVATQIVEQASYKGV